MRKALLFAAMLAAVVLVGVAQAPPDAAQVGSSSGFETILALLVGTIVSPILTEVLKKIPWVDNDLGAALNMGVNVLLYAVAWATLGHHDPATMQTWLLWGFSAAGIGSAGVNVMKSRGSGGSFSGGAAVLCVGLVLMPLASCASAPVTPGVAAPSPALASAARYLGYLETGNTIYESTLIEAGRLHGLHFINDGQLAAIREAGVKCKAALELLRASGQAYLTSQSQADGDRVIQDVLAFNVELAALETAVAAFKGAPHGQPTQ